MARERTIRIFLSYAFTPRQRAYEQKEIHEVLSRAVSSVEARLDLPAKNVRLVPDFAFTEYGRVLRDEILTKIQSADIMIADISDNNPNVLYELGYADALKQDTAIITKSIKGKDTYEVPTDIVVKNRLEYQNIWDIEDRLATALEKRVCKMLDAPLGLADIRKIWFPPDARRIHVIGPKTQAKTEFADVGSLDYDRLNKVGDKAAIIDVLIMLARLYPDAEIKVQVADEFNMETEQNDNMVVIGGPGIQGEDGNAVHRTISEQMNSRVSYPDDYETMKVGDRSLAARHSGGKITKDYGCFARIRNPYNSASVVVMVHGIHTFGVRGAARMFGTDKMYGKNITTILNKLGDDPRFECVAGVDVKNGVPSEPRMEDGGLIPR